MSAKDISSFVAKVEQDDSSGRKEHLTLTKQTSSKRSVTSPQNSVPDPKRAMQPKEQYPRQERRSGPEKHFRKTPDIKQEAGIPQKAKTRASQPTRYTERPRTSTPTPRVTQPGIKPSTAPDLTPSSYPKTGYELQKENPNIQPIGKPISFSEAYENYEMTTIFPKHYIHWKGQGHPPKWMTEEWEASALIIQHPMLTKYDLEERKLEKFSKTFQVTGAFQYFDIDIEAVTNNPDCQEVTITQSCRNFVLENIDEPKTFQISIPIQSWDSLCTKMEEMANTTLSPMFPEDGNNDYETFFTDYNAKQNMVEEMSIRVNNRNQNRRLERTVYIQSGDQCISFPWYHSPPITYLMRQIQTDLDKEDINISMESEVNADIATLTRRTNK